MSKLPARERASLQKDVAVAQGGDSFENLLDVLSRIPEREIETVVRFVRRHRLGIEREGGSSYLADIADRLDQNTSTWLEIVLCARLQQSRGDGSDQFCRFASRL